MAHRDQIAAHIQGSKSLTVSSDWLDSFLASSGPSNRNIPISALTQTALFRVLASDFRNSLSKTPTSLLPVDISDPNVQERRLQGSIPVQVLDIEDIGTSLWSQIEAIERVERGEAIRGREIVRTIAALEDSETTGTGNTHTSNNAMSGNANASGSSGFGPHRLIVQDAAGTMAVGIEMQRIEGVSIEKLPIGAKLMLRNATVARGMVLLAPESAIMLGGKIESLDRSWREGRKARLLQRVAEIGEENQVQPNGTNGNTGARRR
ncbi:hypothetical protein N7510_000453 [Penicillium lagena]|uniref:uncharacterized protein n=1 Tax=Penicillium lagena TaxID=94218 RepID=UPI002540E661|nr:uncharacterized protein N7510_000453 [Penicillium lagena]KAJ5624144.1 hypothetical protein N7510_000453 [Penicillium lagena]